ncbi:MAG: carbonic anhydrase [Sporomusaceae bacterium]|nr:carbonic anhydrase [Sporomusaceae bacterium]
MRKWVSMVVMMAFVLCFAPAAWANSSATGVSADKALQLLTDGNSRFVAEQQKASNIGQARRTELTKGQHPFAIIVSCSDSRVPPELVFDQGLGDLFVIRTAGEVVDDVALGSIEYAVEHVGVHLIVVLGHEDCGAVKAAVAGGEVPGHIGAITKAIEPAVLQAANQSGDKVSNTVKANVDLIVKKLMMTKPIISEGVSHDSVKIAGAVYDLKTGKVIFR